MPRDTTHDERREVVFFDVLQLIDKHHQPLSCFFRRHPGSLRQILLNMLQISVVGQVRFPLKVKTNLGVALFHFLAPADTGRKRCSCGAQRKGMAWN